MKHNFLNMKIKLHTANFIGFWMIIFCLLWNENATAQVLNIDSILNRIEKYNGELNMFYLKMKAQNEYAQSTKSWMPPTLSAGMWQTPYTSFGEGMLMISAEQMIPNPVKQQADYDYELQKNESTESEKNMQRNELFTEAKQNYYDWVILKKKYALYQKTDSLLSLAIQLSQSNYATNNENLSNLYAAQAGLYELRIIENDLVTEMATKKSELKTLMNASLNFDFEIDTLYIIHDYEKMIMDTAWLCKNRSDIKSIDAEINSYVLQQDVEKNKLRPDFGVSLNHMQSFNNMPSAFSAMGMITIPIAPWSAKESKANYAGLQFDIEASQTQKQNLINTAANNLAALQTEIKNAKAQLDVYSKNILPAYQNSYITALFSLNQNTGDIQNVVDALMKYNDASMKKLEVELNLLSLQTEFEHELEIR